MSTIRINGSPLEYAEYSQGEPLVLVHGSASDYRTWYKQQEKFAHHYRVINYSRRYHWPNEQIREDADYSMLEQVDANAIKAEFLGSGFAPLAAEQVRNVYVPTLLITAKHSHRLFHHLADRLEELLPNVERIEIGDASHIMHEDNALTYNRAVEGFFEKHRRVT